MSNKVEFAVGTAHGGFRLTVADGGPGPDGKPITAEKAADLILTRGYVRHNQNESRGESVHTGPGLRAKYSAQRVPSRPDRLAAQLREVLDR
jgi:hypothetical protein